MKPYEYDLSKPLHIIFNENPSAQEKDGTGTSLKSFTDLFSTFPGIQKFELPYDLQKFILLIQLLPDELEFFVWIHPNIKQSMESEDHTFQPLIIADSLKKEYPEIKFQMISRHPQSAPAIIKDKYAVLPITDINQLEEKNIFPQKISDIRHISLTKTTTDQYFDFGIVTALHDDEFEQLKRIFSLKKAEHIKLGDKSVFTGTLENFPNKKIVAIYQSEPGRTDASSITTDLIRQFQPRFVFMTGVCGGSDKTSFGDIVVARFVFTFDKGKISDEGFLSELEIVKTPEDVVRLIREDNARNLTEVQVELMKNEYAKDKFSKFKFQELKTHIEPMACSAAVVDAKGYFKEIIQKVERKAIAVEMEGYGFARAAETTNGGKSKAVIIKSIMDNTTQKDDHAKNYAAYTSALYLKKLLECGTIA